jgi:hypothetical protein
MRLDRITRDTGILRGASVMALCVLTLSVAGAASAEPLLAGARVALELVDGKSDYFVGERIRLRLRFSAAEGADYTIDSMQYFVPHDRLDVTPAEGTFRWQAISNSDVIARQPLPSKGFVVPLMLNDSIVITRPGAYHVSGTTNRLQRGYGVGTITTDEIEIHVAAMPEDDERARVEADTMTLKKGADVKARREAAEDLAYLTGDAATREKVKHYLLSDPDPCVTQSIEKGLAISGNKDLELQLLDKAWRSQQRVPDRALLDQMIHIADLAAGIPVRGWTQIMPEPSAEEKRRSSSQQEFYRQQIEQTLAQRRGDNKAQTEAWLQTAQGK